MEINENTTKIITELLSSCKNQEKRQWLISDKSRLEKFKEECSFLEQNKRLKDNLENLIKNKKVIGTKNKTNSIIAYLFDLTNQEPDLSKPLDYKKKFILTRISPPDIDVDFEEREPVFQYLLKKYGEENTGFISTYNVIQARSAIQNAFKINGITGNNLDADKFSKFISKQVKFRSESFEDAIDVKDLEPYKREYPEIFELAATIYGVKLHAGVHPAGIIISDKPLDNYVPIRKSKDQFVIEYDKDDLENIGLLKNDILKLSTLKQMHSILDLIKVRKNKTIDIDNIDIENREIYKDIFTRCDVNGIFQMESREMQRILQMVKPETFNDIVACNALVRPGPNEAGYPRLYAERKQDPKKITYYHESLKDVLKHTYGLILYQEQVMSICRILAGFSATEADKVRKFIGKKQTDVKKVTEIKNMFINGCTKIGYICEKDANTLWGIIQDFGKYAFNESHSVAYAMVSYQTAYLKKYHYLEFISCLLSITLDENAKAEDVLPTYYKEVRHKNYKLLDPDVNLSKDYFNIVDEKTIIKPFHIIKGIGKNVGTAIQNNQPYTDFDEFLEKNNETPISSDIMELMIENKYFRSLIKDENDEKKLLEKYNVFMQIRKRERTNTPKIKSIMKKEKNILNFDKITEYISGKQSTII